MQCVNLHSFYFTHCATDLSNNAANSTEQDFWFSSTFELILHGSSSVRTAEKLLTIHISLGLLHSLRARSKIRILYKYAVHI